MRRLGTLLVVALAVFTLATLATSLNTVSVQPSVDSGPGETRPAENRSVGQIGGGNDSNNTTDSQQETQTDPESTPTNDTATQLPLWQVVGGLGLVILGSIVALYGLTSGSDAEQVMSQETSSTDSAGPPPERVTLSSDVPASNDVYRAWNALCATLPLDPNEQTPAEIADAAVTAGYGSESVAELTHLFCAVRYGDAEPTSDREQRARELAQTLSLEGHS
jgi:hypothetical protein